MRWCDQSRAIDAAFAGGILLLVVLSVLILFQPQWQRLSALRARALTLRQQLTLSSQVRTGLAHLRADVTAVEQRLAAFDQQLPLEEHLDTYLRQIDQVARRTGFHVLQIKPGSLQQRELYSQLAIAMTAESPFPAFYGFLSALYDMPRLTKVESLSVTRRSDSDLCDIAITLVIYVAKGTHEASGT